ncbi:MAG: hypothetical protein ACYSWW_24710 [Planctomycetota bacterium]
MTRLDCPADSQQLISAHSKSELFIGILYLHRFQCPIPKNYKSSDTKDLRSGQKGAYKPAYKKSEKNAGDQLRDMPVELAEIVVVWHDLPVHIKAAIKALVQTAIQGD